MKRSMPPARNTLFATLLLLVALPTQAWGASKVQGYLLSVSLFYEKLEYEQALEQITHARRLPCTQEETAALSLYEGIILADLSRWDESANAFKRALSLNPAARLPVKVSPKVEQHLEAARQELQRAQAPAKIAAETLPPAGASLRSEQPSLTSHLQQARVLIPAVSGGVLMVAGGTSWMLSRRELSRLRNNDPDLAPQKDRQSSASRGRTYQTVGAGLLGAGLVSLGVAAGLYALGMPSGAVTLGISKDTTSAFVNVRWP